MKKQDSGKFLSSLFDWRNLFKPRNTFKAPSARRQKHKTTSSGRSGIPTNQKIRMAQNRKDAIKKKKRITNKRLLLEERKRKLADITIIAEPDYRGE